MSAVPAAADLTAAVKKTLTSAAFSKFMEQAVHTAVAALQAEPEGVVLPACATTRLRWYESSDYRHYDCTSADGRRSFSMQMERVAEVPRYRNVWYGSETRTDEQGRIWSTQLGYMVQDDFGFLVKVSA